MIFSVTTTICYSLKGFVTGMIVSYRVGARMSSSWTKRISMLPKRSCEIAATTGTMMKAVYRNPAVVRHWAEDIRESVRHGVKWVKNGFRLFYKNVTISRKLAIKGAMGHQLTLRESKLLVRTTSDLFKLVPFSLFIIIPFAELALPIFLRVFPNMLPSTFMEKSLDNAKMARRVRAKKELAEFFQDVIRDMEFHQPHAHSSSNELRAEFEDFIKQKPVFPTVAELSRFKPLFEHNQAFQLEKLDLEHLQRICRTLGLEPFAFRSHVELQLRHYLTKLQNEDRQLMWEGVDSLTFSELQEAVQARGMVVSSSVSEMRTQLEHWLQLSSSKDVPISLLLWIRSVLPGETLFPPESQEEENPEELFEETAERQKERADDVERRLEQLDEMDRVEVSTHGEDKDPTELDRDELLDRFSKLEEEVEILDKIVSLQERLIEGQDNAEIDTIKSEIKRLVNQRLTVRLMMDDHRFYPEDEEEPKNTINR